MEVLGVILILFLGLSVFVFPIWALIKIRSHSEQLDLQRLRIDQLNRDLAEAKAAQLAPKPPQATAAAAIRSEQVEQSPSVEKPRPTAAPSILTGPLPSPTEPPTASPVPIARSALASNAQPDPLPAAASSVPEPPPLPPPMVGATPPVYVPRPRKPAINWEQFMGVKLFAWLGGLALFLGAVFFVKLSIEQGWIPEEVRVALGFLLGAGLIAGGVSVSKKYAVTAQTLCATGIVTLYAVTFACRSIYHFAFFGVIQTFGVMVLITAAAILLAIRMQAQVVAILGMLGGFLTPLLLSTGKDNPLGLFTYIALLDLGLLAVALRQRWHFLVPLAATCTAIMQFGWAVKFLDGSKGTTAILICLVFDFLFLAGFVAAQKRKQATSALSLSVAGIVLVSYAFAWYLGSETPLGLNPLKWLGFVFLADLCVLTLAALDQRSVRLHVISGGCVFLLLGAWTFARLNHDLLEWALGSYLVFAALHSAFPLLLKRLRPGAEPDSWHQLFSPLALVLVLGPILNSGHATFAIWPAILLIDIIALAVAWLTGAFAVIIAVFFLTLIAAAQSIFHLPASSSSGTILLVVLGIAVFFVGTSFKLSKRQARTTGSGQLAKAHRHLPAMSALLPFVLLMMATARLEMQSPHPVFGLSLLLVVLSLGLAAILFDGTLTLLALAGAWLLSVVWQMEHFSVDNAPATMLWHTVFYAVFTGFPFLFHRRFVDQRMPWLSSALAGVLLFPLVLNSIQRAWPNDFLGLVPAVFALPALACLVGILRMDTPSHPRRLGRLAIYGGVALLFITLIFPIQFDRQWITIAWALEGVALLWLYQRVPHRGLPVTGVVLLTVAFARVALNPEILRYPAIGGAAIFNWYLYTFGTVALSLIVGAKLIPSSATFLQRIRAAGWLNSFAAITLFCLINIEIADYFNPDRTRLRFNSSASFAEDMSYTIAWAVYAFALLVVGIWKRSKGARYAALGLLAVTLIKLFFFDLSQLAQLYRIGALFAVAIVAILASVLYQKFVTPDDKPSSNDPS